MQDVIDLAEIETYVGDDGAREWLMIRFYPEKKSVAFEHHYILSNGSQGVWCDSGTGVDVKHVDTVIDALQRVRAMVLEDKP
jgi:hypothetical protein